MGISGGPYIVRDSSLVLELDAADKNSYSGSGTVWSDLTGNGNTGTLTNSPTFNSANNGSIVFDGTDDYVTTGKQIITITSNWTTNVWFRTTGSTNIGSLVVRGAVGENLQWRCEVQGSTGKVNFTMRNPGDQSVLGVTSTNDDKWHMATYTNTSGLVTVYLDANQENSGSISNLGNIAYNVILGRLGDSTGPYYYRGYMGLVRMYNRALSADEITQNYDAQKSRFGL